jgi:acyl carrier protein
MTTAIEARELVRDVLRDIAPDLDVASIDPTARFQEDLQLDSMDLFNVLVALGEQTGIDIPEADYASLGSIEDCAAYVAART